MTMKWEVQVLGTLQGATDEDEADDFEISVLNERGDRNFGWGCEDKIILFSTSGDNDLNPGTKEQFDFALQIAQVLCDRLNELQVETPNASIERLASEERNEETKP